MTARSGSITKRRHGLPRGAILRGREAFSEIFERGEGVRSGNILVKYLQPPAADSAPNPPVAGFAVRRGRTGAAQRNRVRRLLREAWRLERTALANALGGHALRLVILWTGDATEIPRIKLGPVRDDLVGALRKLERRLRSRSHEQTR